MDQIIPSIVPTSSPYFRWLLGGFIFPVAVPWILYKIALSLTYKIRQKAKLQNKVVLITGASSGLGEALATEFYKSGCKVILASRRLEELNRVKKILQELPSPNGIPLHTPAVVQMDLENLKSIPGKAKEAVEIHGKIDVLVNNAGISYRGSIEDTTLDVDMKVMAVNYFGQIALTKAILPYMSEVNSGHIVSIGSIQGKIAMPFRSAYTASKHALQAFFDSLRAELYDRNIKVTVINPGYIKTNLSMNAMTGDGSVYGYLDSTTASGMHPNVAAKKILQEIVNSRSEVLLSNLVPSLAVYLRFICPFAYFAVMKSRARKQDIANCNEHKKS